jgi:hypothetical protein
MKKLLGVLFAGGLVVLGISLATGSPVLAPVSKETKACIHIGEMCGESWDAKKLDDCTKSMKDARKMSGDAPVERSLQCIEESKTCMAAEGCLAGGVGVGAFGELLKGFGNALTK